MLDCLNKVVNKIDVFQEDCSRLIFALRRLVGEDQVINENDFFLKNDEDGYYVYKNNEKVLSYNEEGTFAQPKFSRNTKLIKEATKFLKKNLKESGGSPAPEDFSKPVSEEGGTSVADVAVNPKRMMEDKTDLKQKVIEFLQKNPNPPDKAVHTLAEKLGVEPDKIEAVFYQIATERVKNIKEATFQVKAFDNNSGAVKKSAIAKTPNAAKAAVGNVMGDVTIGKAQEV